MKEIKSAAIIGAGALGLLYAETMKAKIGDNCYFLSEGERYNKIKTTEYVISGKPQRFNAVKAEDLQSDSNKKPDLVIVAVKNHHLTDILPLLQAAITENTIIISVLNGIESEDFFEQQLPQARVIRTVAVGMDAVKEGNKLNYTTSGKLLIGTVQNHGAESFLRILAAFFDSCGMKYEIPEDITRALWWKWMINIGVNQVSAVTGANYGIFHKDQTIQLLMESAMQETINVAKAADVDLRNDDIKEWYPILNSLGAENKTSMLQDIEACRKTEVEAFSGKLIQLAGRYGIEVPVNTALFRIIKTKEKLYS